MRPDDRLLDDIEDRRAARRFFDPNSTSIHRFAAASSGERSIMTASETAHFRDSGLPIGPFQAEPARPQ